MEYAAIGQPELEVRIPAQGRSLRRDQDLGTEFLRLHESASGERLAGNAGRKPEVVLDACARARLAAEGTTIEPDDTQALGRGVHRARESRRAGTDDRDVEQFVVGCSVEHAEAAREPIFRGG